MEGGYSLGAIEADRRFHEAPDRRGADATAVEPLPAAPLPLIHGDTEDPDRWHEACLRTLDEHRKILARSPPATPTRRNASCGPTSPTSRSSPSATEQAGTPFRPCEMMRNETFEA